MVALRFRLIAGLLAMLAAALAVALPLCAIATAAVQRNYAAAG